MYIQPIMNKPSTCGQEKGRESSRGSGEARGTASPARSGPAPDVHEDHPRPRARPKRTSGPADSAVVLISWMGRSTPATKHLLLLQSSLMRNTVTTVDDPIGLLKSASSPDVCSHQNRKEKNVLTTRQWGSSHQDTNTSHYGVHFMYLTTLFANYTSMTLKINR